MSKSSATKLYVEIASAEPYYTVGEGSLFTEDGETFHAELPSIRPSIRVTFPAPLKRSSLIAFKDHVSSAIDSIIEDPAYSWADE